MSQVQVSKLVSKLRYNLKDRRKLKNIEGPQGRHDKIRKVVTALFKYERIELKYELADESRGYAERLISDAIRYGDCHKETMEMASYWLLEKQLVHKLFKVLVPRYQTHSFSYTKMWRASVAIDHIQTPKCVLELRNNIYPPLGPEKCNHKNLIHNILLSEAKKFYYKEKALKTFVKDENLKEREAPNLSATEESLFKSSQAESHKDQIAKQCESVDNLDIDALQITESNSKKTFAPEEAGININAKTTLEKDEKVDENHSSKTDEMLKEK